MRVLSLGYSVNDDLSVNVGQTAYSTDNDRYIHHARY